MDLLNKACFLDPRFRSLPFLSSVEKEVFYDRIFDEVVNLTTPVQTASTSDEQAPQPKKFRLMDLLDDVFQQDDTASDPKTSVRQELDRFNSEEPITEDPLEWWKNNKSRFPGLALLAQKYFAVPATSVPSERAFSLCGHIVNHRSCLLPENVRMLAFLAENLD